MEKLSCKFIQSRYLELIIKPKNTDQIAMLLQRVYFKEKHERVINRLNAGITNVYSFI